MKRTFTLKANGVTVSATLDSRDLNRGPLTAEEVAKAVDRLKDGCIKAMVEMPYMGPDFGHHVKERKR